MARSVQSFGRAGLREVFLDDLHRLVEPSVVLDTEDRLFHDLGEVEVLDLDGQLVLLDAATGRGCSAAFAGRPCPRRARAQAGLGLIGDPASCSPASTAMIASMMLLSGVRSSRDIFSMKSFLSFSILPSFSLLRSSSMSWAKSARTASGARRSSRRGRLLAVHSGPALELGGQQWAWSMLQGGGRISRADRRVRGSSRSGSAGCRTITSAPWVRSSMQAASGRMAGPPRGPSSLGQRLAASPTSASRWPPRDDHGPRQALGRGGSRASFCRRGSPRRRAAAPASGPSAGSEDERHTDSAGGAARAQARA